MRSIRSGVLLALLPLGCGPDHTGPQGGGAGTDEDETDVGEPGMDVPPDVGVEEPPAPCGPTPKEMSTSVVFDGLDAWDHQEGEYTHSCTVENVVGQVEGGLEIALACTDEDQAPVDHTITLTLQPGPEIPIAPGDELRFRFFAYVWWGGDLFWTLRRPDESIVMAGMAGMDVPSAVIDELDLFGVPKSEFFAPFELVLESPCPLECEEPGFVPSCAPCRFRKAIDFSLAGETTRVFARGEGQLGDYFIRVQQSVLYPEVNCTDAPSTYHIWVLIDGG